MMIPRSSPLLLLLCAFLLPSCAPPALMPGGATMIADRLYFGDDIPGGGKVGEKEWSDFLRDEVTPRFPNGLTFWRASGQWRDEQGRIVREGTFVLEVIHDADKSLDSSIEELIGHYRRTFRQESVFWVRVPVSVRF